MADEQMNDVKTDQGSSPPGQGVTAESPTAQDVKPPDPSTGEPSQEPSHEESVPYDRFQQEIAKRKEMEAELEALRNQQVGQTQDSQQQRLQDNWTDLFGNQTARTTTDQQQQQAIPPEDIEARIRDDMYNKPFQTLYPIMMEAARQVNREQRQREARIRGIKDFRDYESTYYSVPEDIVAQTQSDPEIVRYLLAKHYATANNTPQPTPPPQMQQRMQQQYPTQQPSNGPIQQQPKSMEELAEQYRREGEARYQQKLRQQQGVTSEGTATLPTGGDETYELDDAGAALMANLGISSDRLGHVAKRVKLEEDAARIRQGR